MIAWTLPAGQSLGVSVRVGQHGGVVPSVRGHVQVGDVRLTGAEMQHRYPVTAAPVTVTVSALDLARVAPRGGRVALHATVYRPDRIETFTRAMLVDVDDPDGVVWAFVNRHGTYLTGEALSGQETLTVYCEDGSSYPSASPGDTALYHPGQISPPVRVIATNDEQQRSGDILAGVEVEADGGQGFTALSAWPLPPYLNPERPNLKAFLKAAERTLDIRPEQAGRYLHLRLSSGVPLTLIGKLFGVSRVDAPKDAQVIRRVEATMYPAKDSLGGLARQLQAHGVYGATVTDLLQETGEKPLLLDGTWLLNGEHRLNGGGTGLNMTAGEVAAVFRRVPKRGLNTAVTVMRRFKAAGIHARVIVQQRACGELPAPGPRLTVTRHAALLGMRATVPFLTLDGTWLLDGTQELDGIRNV